LSGNTQTCAQAKNILGPEIVTASVKEAVGRLAAKLAPAEEARRRLSTSAREALSKRDRVPVFRLNPPLTFEVEFVTSAQAEHVMLYCPSSKG